MKKFRFYSMMLLSVLMGISLVSCGSTGSATKKEKKAIVLQEGDKATLEVGEDYTTITLPIEQTAEDMALYETDVMGYLSASNAPISTDGRTWDTFPIYYYLHNSNDWLFQGIYSNPEEIQMTKVKQIRIANRRKYLRDFADQMPMLTNSKQKKVDDSFQNEVRFGTQYYYFVEIILKDPR